MSPGKVCIIGYGVVGKGMATIFPKALPIDPAKGLAGYDRTEECELAIVCVPTPMAADGSCDTSHVFDACSRNLARYTLIKSTVPPGTTDELNARFGAGTIAFSPEYMGESTYWTPPEYPAPNCPLTHGFMIVGGELDICSRIADLFLPSVGPATRFRFMTAREAELVKYAENSFFALKVTFANELRRICEKIGANYHQVREGWLDDPRVGPMHTAAFASQRGFSGKCLPKDTAALASFMRANGMNPALLDAVLQVNAAAP